MNPVPPRFLAPIGGLVISLGLLFSTEPVGLWNPMESDGKTVKDASGNGRDGIMLQAATVDGKPGFNGSESAVEIRQVDRIGIRNELTLAAWIKPSTVNRQRLLGKIHFNPTWGTPMPGLLFSETGAIFAGLWDKEGKAKGTLEGRTPVPAQAWTHIALVCDGEKAILYVNAVAEAEAPWTAALGWNDSPLTLGRIKPDDRPFRGLMGEVRLYDRGLTAADMKALVDAGRKTYPATAGVAEVARKTVPVASRVNPKDPWRNYATTTVDLLTGFKPAASVELDRYGGLAARKAEAKGFFYCKKDGERWWLVDPDGGYFFHAAIVALSPGGSKAIRDHFQVRFGSKEKWAEETAVLLKDSGFNGAGAWSDVEALRGAKNRMAYTIIKGFAVGFAKSKGLNRPGVGHSGFLNDSIPIFNEDFPAFCAQHAKELEPTKNDPWLLGIFSDNELLTPDLSKYLGLDPMEPAQKPNYEAARNFLAKKTGKKDPGPADVTASLKSEFMGVVFGRYFEVVSKAIKAVDPNHLFIGSRFHSSEKGNPHVWRETGKYLDAVSVNLYGEWTPDQERIRDWNAWSGKPVLITEWYTKADDSGFPNTTGAGWIVKTQKDRGRFYQNFALSLLESKGVVGWHWFKYMDNDTNDLNAEPSNRDSNKGIVQVNFDPYLECMAFMKELNRQIYPLMDFFDRK